MTQVVLLVAVLALTGILALLVHLARQQAIPLGLLRVLTGVCAAALILMLLSDWPLELLAGFWADHSVLAGLLSTVLLLAMGFLAYEDSEQRRQERLDSSLTAAGLSGVVDHVVDVEVALSLLSYEEPPTRPGWKDWDDPQGKPLRWLRRHRSHLSASQPLETSRDPRVRPPSLRSASPGDRQWHHLLIDQAVRRLSAALRDWSPVIGTSRNGRVMLVAVASIRQELMRLAELMEHVDPTEAEKLLLRLRLRCRLLACFFERQSGNYPPRVEVLPDMRGLEALNAGEVDEIAPDHQALSRDWRDALAATRKSMAQVTP